MKETNKNMHNKSKIRGIFQKMLISNKALSSNLSFKLAVALLTITILGIIVTGGDVIVEEGDLNVSEDLITDTNTFFVDSTNNNVGIGTTGPADKLDVRDGAFVLSDADVAHGITDIVGTNGYGEITAVSGTAGGLEISGLSDTDAMALNLQGIIGSTDPTDTTPAIVMGAYKANGAGVQALGNAETVLQVRNFATNLVTVLGSGSVGIGAASPNEKLEVAGGVKAAGSVGLGGTYASSAMLDFYSGKTRVLTWGADTSTLGGFQLYQGTSNNGVNNIPIEVTAGGNVLLAQSQSFVGIGTTVPLHKLQVYGALKVGGDASELVGQVILGNDASTASSVGIFRGSSAGASGGGHWLNLQGFSGINFIVNGNNMGTGSPDVTIQTDGSVGIGTTNPTTLLTMSTTTLSTGAMLTMLSNFHTDGNYQGIQFGDYSQPTAYIKDAIFVKTHETDSDNNVNSMHFALNNVAGASNVTIADAKMSILSSGNVGIGAASPNEKLEVAGGVKAAGSVGLGGTYASSAMLDFFSGKTRVLTFGADTSTLGGFQIYQGTSNNGANNIPIEVTAGGNVLLAQSQSFVGIGTTAPGSTLHVVGSFNVSGNTILGDASGDTLTINPNSATIANNLSFDSGTLFIDSTNNNVGIGTANPNATLTIKVGGTTIADEWTVRSDRDIKTDIQELNIDNFDFSKASLYKYKIKYQEPVYEEIDGELVQTDTKEKTTREHIGLMKDEVPEECAQDGGIDLYCLISLLYAKTQQQENEIQTFKDELCLKDSSYSWCK